MRPSDHAGFSLVEFTVALMIVAISALFAAPMYYKLANSSRVTSVTNELVATLTYARTQSVMQAHPVSGCSSDNGSSCTDTPWAQGYIVFMDGGTLGAVDAGDRVLKQRLARSPRVTIMLGTVAATFASARAAPSLRGIRWMRLYLPTSHKAPWHTGWIAYCL